MTQFKIGIIGATGFATERMLPELQKSSVCKVVGIQSRNFEKLKAVAEEFKVEKYYLSIHELLSADVYDLIYIALPPYRHLNAIEECLQSGRVVNILCEKPLVVDRKDLARLQEWRSENIKSTSIYVGHHIRQQKVIADLKNLLDSKVIGEAIFATGEWSYKLDPQAPYATWKLDQSKGGTSVMGDPGIHVVDFMYFLFGLPTKVGAYGASVVYPSTIDSVTALMGYPDKQVVIHTSQTSSYSQNNLLILGTKGRIEIEDSFSQTYIKSIRIITEKGIETKNYEETFLYKNEVENILGVFKDGVSATTLEEAITETSILFDMQDTLGSH